MNENRDMCEMDGGSEAGGFKLMKTEPNRRYYRFTGQQTIRNNTVNRQKTQ